MSRYTSSGSYGHHCEKITSPWGTYYRMSWTIDFHGNRIRYPRQFSRDTEDPKAARRFCQRWNIPMPEGLDES